MEFRILGHLEVRVSDSALKLGSAKQQTVLAVLAVEADHFVTADALVDRVWGDAPPVEARGVLHTYIARLRKQLAEAQPTDGGPVIVRQSSGYRLDVTAEQVDALLLRRLRARARESSEPDARQALLRQAVDLWRGEPLAGLPGEWAAVVRESLSQQYVGVLTEWAAGELARRHFGPVSDRLAAAVDKFPLAEPLVVLLMRALQQSGRRAEALSLYARSRHRIAEELGVEPSAELRDLHQAMLREPLVVERDGRALTPTGAPTPAPAPEDTQEDVSPGCHLPADLSDFVGCEAEIRTAQKALTGAPANRAPHLPVVMFSGPGGLGKTALSIHLAHQLRGHFPDGQIFVSLHGHRDAPGELFGRVLRALGVPNAHRLRTPADKIARYRAAISGRRYLIVLDDAPTAGEIRELVPGSAGTALVISSRARLTTLSGACHVEVRFFTPEKSAELLGRIIGPDRVAAEPEMVQSLVELCGGMPLALRIAGARLAARPHWPVSRLVGRMSDERRRLDEMTADGLAVRVSIAVGYAGLTEDARRLFRLVGFLGVTTFGPWLAAALLDSDHEEAEDLLESLFDARLVEVLDGRYRMHDLVRLYAQELAVEEDDQVAGREAVTRAVWTAAAIVLQVGQHTLFAAPRLPVPATAATDTPYAAVVDDSPTWLVTEGDSLVSLVERAAALGLDVAACALADTLMRASFAMRNELHRWDRTHAAALKAAQTAGNAGAEAVIQTGIARLLCVQDRFDEAQRAFRTAIELFETAGDQRGAAIACIGLGRILSDFGPYPEAVPLLDQALTVMEEAGEYAAAAEAAYSLGVVHRELCRDESAVRAFEQSGAGYRRISHWRGEAMSLRGIGLVRRAQGALSEAEDWFQRAHDMIGRHGDKHLQCYTAQSLAKVWIRMGRPERARTPLEQSLAVVRERSDRFGIALMHRTIGEMHLAADQPGVALQHLLPSRDLWLEIGHRLGAARTMRDIGAAHAAAGDCAAAHDAWRNALETFTAFDAREASELPGWRQQWGCTCDIFGVTGAASEQEAAAAGTAPR
ncbi:DNA-binding SARP family transcriptional activator [Micromonospora pisi]|uniref:DNA-binding SARP family transcriptional activator n=1 Tax=Micromonospora pisi TaxID=589240 RepID=A0A495JSF1_9ACTN|nr:tetratricopeptide repeat protein [Micromonospora pisi]RKR91903.1 DNA-binding SARP family transcriptional activator [Micromonospora pisi]